MKRKTVQTAAISLSAVSIASSLSLPIYVKAAEVSDSSLFVSEDTSVEDTVNEDSVSAEAIDAKQNLADKGTILEEAAAATVDAVTDASQSCAEAKTVAESAVDAISNEDTTEEQAATIMADTKEAVDQADADLATAQASYETALANYETAKAEYEAAIDEFYNQLGQAHANYNSSKRELKAYQEKLAAMEAELETSRQDLVSAGAESLLAADDNIADVPSYVASVVQYYYAPTNQLAEGQSISNFAVVDSSKDYVSVSYDVIGADGQVVHTVTSDYGFLVDETTGEISIYEDKLNYQQEEIGSHWVATGFYIPRYVTDYNYKGNYYHPGKAFSWEDAKANLNPQVEQLFDSSIFKYYNSEANLYSGTGWLYPDMTKLDINYKIYYDKIETYNFKPNGYDYESTVQSWKEQGVQIVSSKEEFDRGTIRFVRGIKVSEAIANSQYKSVEDLYAAVQREAVKQQGVVGIDKETTDILGVKEEKEYGESFLVNTKVFGNFAEDYKVYIDSLRDKNNSYTKLLADVIEAKKQCEALGQQVASYQDQIDRLSVTNSYNPSMTIALLSAKLEKAELLYSDAQVNLEEAKSAFAKAQGMFDTRYTVIPAVEEILEEVSTDSSEDEQVSYPVKKEVVEEILEEEKLEEQEPEQERSGGYSTSYEAVGQAQEELPVEEEQTPQGPKQEVVIQESETPKGITLAGLLARGKWFIGLAGVSSAGVGVAAIEAKRRAAMKLIDKLNQ